MAGTKCTDAQRRRPGVVAVVEVLAMILLLGGGAGAYAADEPTGRIERIQLKTEVASTKVIVMLSEPLPFAVHVLDGDPAGKSGRRLVLDFEKTTIGPEAMTPIEVDDGLVQKIRTGQFTAGTARIVLELASDTKHSVEAYEAPPHVTIAITGPTTSATPAASPDLFKQR